MNDHLHTGFGLYVCNFRLFQRALAFLDLFSMGRRMVYFHNYMSSRKPLKAVLETLWRPLGDTFGASWQPHGASWGFLEPLWAAKAIFKRFRCDFDAQNEGQFGRKIGLDIDF